MKESDSFSKKQKVLNQILCVYILVLAILLIVASFLPEGRLEKQVNDYLAINRMVQRILGVIMIIFVSQLYKRIKAAWVIAVVLIALNIGIHTVMRRHFIHKGFLFMEIIALFVLMFSHKYYCRSSDRHSIKKSVTYFIVIVIVFFTNAVLGYIDIIRSVGSGAFSFYDAIKKAGNMIIGIGNTPQLQTSGGALYEQFVFWFTWVGIIICLALLLTPFVYRPRATKEEREKARELVEKYGQNPSAYLTLEEDKLLYFGKTVKGVVAYGIIKDTIVINGDPICADEDFLILLSEFKNYCENNVYSMIFLSTTKKYLSEYKRLDFGFVKCGEEARIDLQDWSLKGGKIAKVRASINHADKAGITVVEYKVALEKNATIEKALNDISQEWLSMKNSGELSFTLGTVGFEEPLNKRYFYAMDIDKKIVSFIVLTPFASMTGYYVDITRRRKEVPGGVMEKLIYDASMTLKEEGIKYISLGLAPLVNTDEKEDKITMKVFDYIYEHLNGIYGFKDLYRAKLKYNPTSWEDCYFVYSPKIITPQMAYAVVKIQNPKGIKDYIAGYISSKKKTHERAEMKNIAEEEHLQSPEMKKDE